MERYLKIIIISLLVIISVGCNFEGMREQANQQFGDQHFKTAISLIELHKVREGEYPNTLRDLKYVGDWDKIIFNSVKYKRLDTGYELDLVNGWVGTPDDLQYPEEFWRGLGLVKSNLKEED